MNFDRASDMPPRTRAPRLLITGGSGVVGTALLPRLRDAEVTCLTYRRPIENDGMTHLAGDIRRPRLGLDALAYRSLANRIDAIVHSAAVTSFTGEVATLWETNVEGTRNVLALARDASVPLFYVSTAFVGMNENSLLPSRPLPYAASKRAAEELIRESDVPHVFLRPSIVVGDSWSGEVARFQGFYQLAGALLRGVLPVLPCVPTWLVDFVPQDLVASVIAAAVLGMQLSDEEIWITAGKRALTIRETVDVLVAFSEDVGKPVPNPRYVSPDMYERLIVPVFLPALPRPTRLLVKGMFEHVAPYIATDTPFPCALDADTGWNRRDVLRRSVEFWARETGHLTASSRPAS